MLTRNTLLAGEEQTAHEAAAELPPVWKGVRRLYLGGLVASGVAQAAAAAGIAWFTPQLFDAATPAARWTLTIGLLSACLLYTSPSPRDRQKSRMPSSA